MMMGGRSSTRRGEDRPGTFNLSPPVCCSVAVPPACRVCDGRVEWLCGSGCGGVARWQAKVPRPLALPVAYVRCVLPLFSPFLLPELRRIAWLVALYSGENALMTCGY